MRRAGSTKGNTSGLQVDKATEGQGSDTFWTQSWIRITISVLTFSVASLATCVSVAGTEACRGPLPLAPPRTPRHLPEPVAKAAAPPRAWTVREVHVDGVPRNRSDELTRDSPWCRRPARDQLGRVGVGDQTSECTPYFVPRCNVKTTVTIFLAPKVISSLRPVDKERHAVSWHLYTWCVGTQNRTLVGRIVQQDGAAEAKGRSNKPTGDEIVTHKRAARRGCRSLKSRERKRCRAPYPALEYKRVANHDCSLLRNLRQFYREV